MSVDYTLNPTDLQSILPILVAVFSFVLYWFLAHSERIKRHYYGKYDFDQAAERHIFFRKAVGFLSMGILPIVICLSFLDLPFETYGLTYIAETASFTLIWTIGLCVIIVPFIYWSAKNPKSFEKFPQVRSRTWSRKMIYKAGFGWMIYLLGYELLFRGVLLLPIAAVLGVWPAIAINTAIYSATHIPKGLGETIGSIPLGVVLCVLTLSSGTIWIAFFVHLAMAWINLGTVLKYNPELTVVNRFTKKGFKFSPPK